MFSWDWFRIVLECVNLIWHWFTHYSRLYRVPKIVVSNGPLRVFDLLSEVIGWPETLKFGIIGFLLLSATRSFFREALSPSGAERQGVWRTSPPLDVDAIKSRTPARVNILCLVWECNLYYQYYASPSRRQNIHCILIRFQQNMCRVQ